MTKEESRKLATGFVEWIIANDWSITNYRSQFVGYSWHKKSNTAPLTTTQLFAKYQKSLPDKPIKA
jgi:hypothetical protein